MSPLPDSGILGAPWLHPEETTISRENKSSNVKHCVADWSSHNIRPRPGRRRGTTPVLAEILFAALLLLTALCATSEAKVQYHRNSEFAQYARRGEILVERRPEPRADWRLYARQGGDPFDVSSAAASSTKTRSAASISTSTLTSLSASVTPPVSFSTAGSSQSTSSLPSTSTSVPATNSALPRPFDTSLGSNFTMSSCPSFFKTFLANTTFTSCLPFSLLLQNSQSFFQSAHSLVLITRTLDATCNVNFPVCSSLMSSLATQMRDNSNCGADYTLENPIVRQAYAGFLSYATLYQASCLKDGGGNYCFANAITNTSSPTDSYVYYLPLGVNLPGGSRPTCSPCLQQTMGVFAETAGNLSQPISTDYVSAATQIDSGCGPNFVNQSVTPIQGSEPSTSGAVIGMVNHLPVLVAASAGLLLFWG